MLLTEFFNQPENKTKENRPQFTWTDYECVPDMETRLKIVEAFFTSNYSLFESNDPEMTEYFLSLRPADTLVPGKKYITAVLGLVNNKLEQMQPIEVNQFIKQHSNIVILKCADGKETEYPNKNIVGKLTVDTFLFNSTEEYNKFRSLAQLKFDLALPECRVSLDESNEMSDVVNARSLVGKALSNPARRQEYFDFLAHLRAKHGKEYSTTVHKKATELSKPTQVAEATNPTDTITVDVPLFIRLLEYAREDAKTDMDLHKVTERITALSAQGRALGMNDYNKICNPKE